MIIYYLKTSNNRHSRGPHADYPSLFVPVLANTDYKKFTFATLHMLKDTDVMCNLALFLDTTNVNSAQCGCNDIGKYYCLTVQRMHGYANSQEFISG